MAEILNIQSPIVYDDSIKKIEYHSYQPYTSSEIKNSDKIRISIQNQDSCMYPAGSYVRYIGKATKSDNNALANTEFVNNGLAHVLEEVRYEMAGIEIDKCKNPGITCTMKGCLSFNPSQTNMLANAGWGTVAGSLPILDASGNFDVLIPLSMLLGFAEDHKKMVVNMKHDLILVRSRTDMNCVLQTNTAPSGNATYEQFKLTISKIEWVMPYITLSDKFKVNLYNFISKDRPIEIGFRTWELYEYPKLPTTNRHIWSVKTSNQLEKPRFVILGFQTNRKDRRTANASLFDHCQISNVRLYLNSQYYPYNNLNLDINQNQYSMLYEMYAQFQNSYYNKDPQPVLSKEDFKNNMPLIVIDCSKQDESIRQGPVDIRLEFEAKANFPDNTVAYCLILHDRLIQYKPISGDVRKII